MFERGKSYKRRQISERLGGGEQDYLPHQNGRVTYGAFSRDLNPDAPLVILPGSGPEIEKWATVFASQDGDIPVFIKKRSNEWVYRGQYRCERMTRDPDEISAQAKKTGRTDISMVLYLSRQGEG